MDDKNYWMNYYKKNFTLTDPSSFAEYVLPYLEKNKKLIELGCGNGRDSVYFSKNKVQVLGIDQVKCQIDYLNKEYGNHDLKFVSDDFTDLNENIDNDFDYIYSRFTFHSINEKKEDNTLDWIESNIKINGLFFLEARSIKDPMYKKGKSLSDNENFTDHYRRYMDLKTIINKLEKKGFSILYKIESDGLAVYKDDDPVVIRIIAKKI